MCMCVWDRVGVGEQGDCKMWYVVRIRKAIADQDIGLCSDFASIKLIVETACAVWCLSEAYRQLWF